MWARCPKGPCWTDEGSGNEPMDGVDQGRKDIARWKRREDKSHRRLSREDKRNHGWQSPARQTKTIASDHALHTLQARRYDTKHSFTKIQSNHIIHSFILYALTAYLTEGKAASFRHCLCVFFLSSALERALRFARVSFLRRSFGLYLAFSQALRKPSFCC